MRLMNTTMPGSCADVGGQPYAVDVALLQYAHAGEPMIRRSAVASRMYRAAVVVRIAHRQLVTAARKCLPRRLRYRAGVPNVLNLPDRANVVLDGTDVGVVTDITVAGDHADVTSRIAPDVAVPSNVHATLQQATVLGDIYVALEPDEENDSAPPLTPGGRIPLIQTTSPPQLEDTIANLAKFVASGSIQRAQNTVIRLNNLNPPEPEIRALAGRVATDLSDLSDNVDLVDMWLDGVADTGNVMYAKLPAFQHWFSPAGMLGFDRGMEVASYVGILLPSIGSISNGGFSFVASAGFARHDHGGDTAQQVGGGRRNSAMAQDLDRRIPPRRQVSGNQHHIDCRT